MSEGGAPKKVLSSITVKKEKALKKPVVSTSATKMASSVSMLKGLKKTPTQAATKSLTTAAQTSVKRVSPVAKAATKSLTTAAQTSVKRVTPVAQAATKSLTTAAQTSVKRVTPVAQAATKSLTTAAQTSVKRVTPVAQAATKSLTTAAQGATKSLTTAAKSVKTAAQSSVKSLTTAAQSATKSIQGIKLPQTSTLGFTKGSVADTAVTSLVDKIKQAEKSTVEGTISKLTGISTATSKKLSELDQQLATTAKSTYSINSIFTSIKTFVYNLYIAIPIAIGAYITQLRRWDATVWTFTLLILFIFLIVLYFTSGFTAWTMTDLNKKAKSVSNQLTVLNDRMAILSSFSKLKKEFFTDMAKPQVDPSTLSMIDIQPQTIKQIGYLGPQPEGTFDAEDGTSQALLAGIRSFVFQIDYLDKTLNDKFSPPGIPCLLYRADDGALVSKNSAEISKVAETLANLAFRPESPNHAAPLLLYLHIRRAPSILREPEEYKEFLSRIATALKPLAPQHLGMSPLGIFHRQKQESVLVSSPLKTFEGQVIILCNADTSIFRKGPRVDPADDLDYWVNMRVYLGDPNDTIGITQAPAPGVTPHAVILNLANLSSMTEKQTDDFAITAKKAFIIAMPSQASNPTTTMLDTALNKLGVNMVPLDIFSDSIEQTKSLIAEYNGMPIRSKPAFLRNNS